MRPLSSALCLQSLGFLAQARARTRPQCSARVCPECAPRDPRSLTDSPVRISTAACPDYARVHGAALAGVTSWSVSTTLQDPAPPTNRVSSAVASRTRATSLSGT